MAAPPSSTSTRDPFFDIARVVALVGMIGTHTSNALLADTFKHNEAYYAWRFLTGLVAPLFLVLAGWLFARGRSGSSWSASRTVRYLSYVALGYALHWPVRDWLDWRTISDVSWQRFIQVDVLQLLGIGLITLQVLRWALPSTHAFRVAAGAAGLGIAATTPLVASVDWTGLLPAALASYVWQGPGTLFPIFPWMAYLLAGAALAGVAPTGHGHPRHRFVRLATGGTLLVAVGWAAELFGPQWLRELDYWRTSPLLVCVRLGAVLLVLALSAAVPPLPTRWARGVRIFAERSLLVYVLHVVLVYGSVYSFGLRRYFGATMTPMGVAVTTAALVLVCWAAAWLRTRGTAWPLQGPGVSLPGRA